MNHGRLVNNTKISWLSWIRSGSSKHYLLLAFFFFVGLELIVVFHRYIILLAGILALLIGYGIFLIRHEEQHLFHPLQSILPLLATTGLIGFSFFLPSDLTLHLYFVAAAAILYWLLKNGAKHAYPTWNWTLSTLIYFLNIAVIFGLNWHLSLPLLFTLSMIMLVTALICLQAMRRIVPGALHTLLISLTMALSLTQISWVMQFLPIHWLVQSGLLALTYYVSFHLLSLSIVHQLRRRDLVEYAGIGGAALLILLLTARWL